MIAVRHLLLANAARLLFIALSLVVTAPDAAAQSPESEFDWRTSLILHLAADDASRAAESTSTLVDLVAQALQTDWGPHALVVETGSDALDVHDDWQRVAEAARKKGAILALRLAASKSGEDWSALSTWSKATGVRHVIRNDLNGNGAELLLPEHVDVIDAAIGTVTPDDYGNDAGLDKLYRELAARARSEPKPVITSVELSQEALRIPGRILMTPGALQLTLNGHPTIPDLWRQVAAFRSRHPAVAGGEHIPLVNNTFSFARRSTDSKIEDTVVVVFGASGNATINVSRVFPDNAMLQEALTGRTAFVSFGMATFEAGPSGILLIEEAF